MLAKAKTSICTNIYFFLYLVSRPIQDCQKAVNLLFPYRIQNYAIKPWYKWRKSNGVLISLTMTIFDTVQNNRSQIQRMNFLLLHGECFKQVDDFSSPSQKPLD